MLFFHPGKHSNWYNKLYVTLILSHYYHWRHGDIKMWSRNRTVSQSHTKKKKKGKKEKKERRKGRARGTMSEREKQVGRDKENLEKQIFLFLNDNGFWEKTLTNFKSSTTVFVMFSYLVTVGYVKYLFFLPYYFINILKIFECQIIPCFNSVIY